MHEKSRREREESRIWVVQKATYCWKKKHVGRDEEEKRGRKSRRSGGELVVVVILILLESQVARKFYCSKKSTRGENLVEAVNPFPVAFGIPHLRIPRRARARASLQKRPRKCGRGSSARAQKRERRREKMK